MSIETTGKYWCKDGSRDSTMSLPVDNKVAFLLLENICRKGDVDSWGKMRPGLYEF